MPLTNYSGNYSPNAGMPPPPVVDLPVEHRPAPSYYEPPPPNFYEELSFGEPAFDYEFQTASPVPPVCVKCGSGDDVKVRDFSKSYTPPWAYLSVLLGPIVATLIIMGLQKQHKLKGMFCPPCNSKYKRGALLHGASALIFLVTLYRRPV
jgi:hypothetical protein